MSSIKEEKEQERLRTAGEHLPIAEHRRALVIGAQREKSIGAKIANRFLSEGITAVQPDRRIEVRRYNYWLDSQVASADILVLANGRTHLDWLGDQKQGDISNVIDDSLTASVIAVNNYVRATRARRCRRYIVLIGSMAHRKVLNGSAPYCAAKAGLDHFARCAAWELTPMGYRVFVVHPGNVEDTPMTEDTIQGLMEYRNLTREEAEAYWGDRNLMPNWLSSDEIANTVSWLVSGAADHLTGSSIEMGGGQR